MPQPALDPADIGPVATAIRLAARGFSVFPLVPGTKVPAVRRDWEGAARADPVGVLDGWPDRRCNVGVACGPSGLVVLDLDVAKGPDDGCGFRHGADSLREVAAGRVVPMTFTVVTPSGGRHLYFRAPRDRKLRNTAGKIGPLIDTRGVGGYVVAPGSIIKGRRYRAVRDVPVVELPGWLAEVLADRPVTRTAAPRRGFDEISPAYAAAALRNELDRVLRARPGTRNDTLNRAAFALGRLVGSGVLDRATVVDELRDAGERTGLSVREVRSTVESGIGAGMARGRRVGRVAAEERLAG